MTPLLFVLAVAFGILVGIWIACFAGLQRKAAKDLLREAFCAGFRSCQESHPKDGPKTSGGGTIANGKHPLSSHQKVQGLLPFFTLDPFFPLHGHFPSLLTSTNQNIRYRTLSKIERLIPAFLLLFLLPSFARGQATPLPDAPSPKPQQIDRKAFFAGAGLLAAAKTADAISTRELLDRGGWENDPLFGRHPSAARQAEINAAIFAGQVAVYYFTERSRHSWVRWTGRTWLGLTIANHARLASCNAGIDVRSATVTNCHDWGIL